MLKCLRFYSLRWSYLKCTSTEIDLFKVYKQKRIGFKEIRQLETKHKHRSDNDSTSSFVQQSISLPNIDHIHFFAKKKRFILSLLLHCYFNTAVCIPALPPIIEKLNKIEFWDNL